MSAKTTLLASYEYLDSTLNAIKRLRKAKFSVKAYSAYPDHEIEDAMGYGQSPVRVWTLVGCLTGTATGFAITTFTSVDWPLVVGGKPIVSIPAFVVIAFELTVLFGALATVIGLFVLSRVPDPKLPVVYDPEFTAGRYGVAVEASGARAEEARAILEDEDPAELRESGEGEGAE